MGPNTEPCDGFGADRARPALDVRLPAAPESLLPRLDALLDDYEPFAVSDGGDDNPTGAARRRRCSSVACTSSRRKPATPHGWR